MSFVELRFNNVVILAIKGIYLLLELEDGKPFYAFKGIPYAQPPVKDLRFAVSNHFLITSNRIYSTLIELSLAESPLSVYSSRLQIL